MFPRPFRTPDTVAVLRHVRAHALAGDAVWVQWPEAPTVRYHGDLLGVAPDATVVDGVSGACRGSSLGPAAQRATRVWVIFGYRLSTAPRTERAELLGEISTLGVEQDAFERGGTVAYLFDLAGARRLPGTQPATPPGTEPVPLGLQCVRLEAPDGPLRTGLRSAPLGSGRLT
jgi:hypothetical protein